MKGSVAVSRGAGGSQVLSTRGSLGLLVHHR